MLKFIKKLGLIFSCLLMVSCSSEHNERGYVIQKNHTEAYNTLMTTFVYSGKTLIPITHVIHHAESWSLNLRDEVQGNYKYYTVYLKDTEVWNTIQVGDYFIWDTTTCYDCEPTTRERQ